MPPKIITMCPFDDDDGRSIIGASSAAASSDTSSSSLCATGCGEVRAGGSSIFCKGHKRTSDNVYNQEKSRTGGHGDPVVNHLR